jgi:hypothetical protein
VPPHHLLPHGRLSPPRLQRLLSRRVPLHRRPPHGLLSHLPLHRLPPHRGLSHRLLSHRVPLRRLSPHGLSHRLFTSSQLSGQC